MVSTVLRKSTNRCERCELFIRRTDCKPETNPCKTCIALQFGTPLKMSAKGHSFTVPDNDPVMLMFDKAMKSAGCYDKHVQMKECMLNNRDWKMCKKEWQLCQKCMIGSMTQKLMQKQTEGPSFTVLDNDPVMLMFEKAIKSAGCHDKHVQMKECILNNRDWKMCQKEVELFKKCLIEHREQIQKQKQEQTTN